MPLLRCLIGLVFVLCAPLAHAQGALSGIGIVLMHGKGGQPGGPIAGLAHELGAQGAQVVMPRMPWSGSRGVAASYDATYDEALAGIDAAVAQLRARGARKIVIAGQSLGANAAIGYAARRPSGLAGVIALAPGQTPDRMRKPDVLQAVAQAKQLVAAGQGSQRGVYPDGNQGQWSHVPATAAAWLSYNDPNGPAVMPKNAARISAPLLYVIGTSDPLYREGRGYIFGRARPNPKSRYIEISAGHFDTPDKARAEVIDWLKTL